MTEQNDLFTDDFDAMLDQKRLCIGPLYELEFEVAALIFSQNFSLVINKCINNSDEENMTSFELEWIERGTITHFNASYQEMCLDTYVLVPIFTDADYTQHKHRCKALGGEMISSNEFKLFSQSFVNVVQKFMKEKLLSNLYIGTWITGGYEYASSIEDVCPYIFLDADDANITNFSEIEMPCLVQEWVNLCIVPVFTHFTLYSPLIKIYDRTYFLQESTKNFFYWKGLRDSYFKSDQDNWKLESFLHTESCSLKNAILPIGRNHCIQNKTKQSFPFIFTKCNENEFSCSDGTCLPKFARCNNTVECFDESDEESCDTTEKAKGYVTTKPPPPLKNDSLFNISYFVWINNIADIKADDGIAIVDIIIAFLWRDPRLVFWNPAPNEEIKCDTIWSPKMAMANGHPSGFKITFETYRSACSVASEISNLDIHPTLSPEDPYMGKY